MQTYTYYSKESERPTVKLTAANVTRVFTAPTVLVKINTLHTTIEDGEYKVWAYGGVLVNAITALRNANRVFELLEKKGVRLGVLTEDFIGAAEYVLFTRNQDGGYNMSLKNFDFGLPQDIVNLRRATELAKEAQRKYNTLRHHVRLSERVNLEATNATTCLKHAIMVSRAVEPGEHQTTIDTRARLLAEAMAWVQ